MDQKSRRKERGFPAEREDSVRAMIDGSAAPSSLLPMSSVSSPKPRPSSRLVGLLSLPVLISIRLSVCELYRRAKAEFLEEVRKEKREKERGKIEAIRKAKTKTLLLSLP